MKIGELFIQIGVAGTDKSVDSLQSVQRGLKDTMSAAFGVTAAITSAVYAFRKFGEQSNATGMDLKNFENTTGLSTDSLQRWQQLGISAGQSAETMTAAFSRVQAVMTDMALGKAFPEGIGRIQNELTRLGKPIDIGRAQTDTAYMMSKLREYALDTAIQPQYRTSALKSFLSEGAITALMGSGKFNLGAATDIYSRKDISAQSGMQAGWNKLIWNFEHSIGRLNAQFGPGLLKDITQVSNAFLDMVKSLAELNQVLPVFRLLSASIRGWAEIFGYTKEVITEGTGFGKTQAKAFGKDMLQTMLGQGNEKFNLKGLPTAFFEPSLQSEMTKQVVNNLNTNVQVDGTGKDGAELGAIIGAAVNDSLSDILNSTFRQTPNASTGSGN